MVIKITSVCKEEKQFCQNTIENFEKENKEFLNNPIVFSFLKKPEHRNVYYNAICEPTQENRDKLDLLFKSFYFNIRFTSHMASTIRYNSINYDKRNRILNERFILTLDAKVSNQSGETSFKELLFDEDKIHKPDIAAIGEDILEHIESPALYKAVKSLSPKQKEIIQYVYLHGYNLTQVAKILNQSQQSISRAHKLALKKMYNTVKKEWGGNGN